MVHEEGMIPMKVALLFDHFGPYHLTRLRGAVKAGLTVTGVEFYGRSRDYAWEPTNSGEFMVKTVCKSAEISKREFHLALWALLDQVNPDAVTIPGWAAYEALTALEWCLVRKVPAIMMSESCAHDEARQFWKEWIKRRIVSCCPSALVGGSLHRVYIQELGATPRQIALGYDAVDNDYFAAGARAGACAQSSFLASARFIEKKNLSRLIDAYARYKKAMLASASGNMQPWKLVLLGDGELRPLLELQIQELALQDCVSLPGFFQYQELPEQYKKASTFIHASTIEQWGLVVNEAMASGLPVLVSNRCGCAPDLVHDGRNGFRFDPYDTDALTKLMLKMSSMAEEKRLEMGRMSQEIIRDWGPDHFGKGLLEAAKMALSKRARSGGVLDRLLIMMLRKL